MRITLADFAWVTGFFFIIIALVAHSHGFFGAEIVYGRRDSSPMWLSSTDNSQHNFAEYLQDDYTSFGGRHWFIDT